MLRAAVSAFLKSRHRVFITLEDRRMDIVQALQDSGAFAGKQNTVWLQKKAQRAVRMPLGFQHKEFPFSQRNPLSFPDNPIHRQSLCKNLRVRSRLVFFSRVFAQFFHQLPRSGAKQNILRVLRPQGHRLRISLFYIGKRSDVIIVAMAEQYIIQLPAIQLSSEIFNHSAAAVSHTAV